MEPPYYHKKKEHDSADMFFLIIEKLQNVILLKNITLMTKYIIKYPTRYGKRNEPLMLKSLKYSKLDQPNTWDSIGTYLGPKNSPNSTAHYTITMIKTRCPTYYHYTP